MKDQARRIWVVVADGGDARILLSRHRDQDLTELPLAGKNDPRLASHGKDQEDVHHTPVFKPTEEQRRESKFIDTLAETLQTGVARKECDGLVLVAPAKVMGHLRKALNENTHKAIIAELVHDYTNQNARFIHDHVKEHLPL